MKEIIILVRNRPGAVAEVSQTLADAGVNIEELDAEAAVENGVITLTVDKYDLALHVLNEAGFRAISEDAIVLRLKDEPGALARIASRLQEEQINIRSLRIAQRLGKDSLVTLVTDRQEEARLLLADLTVSS